MKKSLIFITLFLILTLLICGCTKIQSQQVQAQWNNDTHSEGLFKKLPNNNTDCGEAINDLANDNCYFDNALNKGNSSLCEDIIDEQIKDTCYLELARQSNGGDASLCEKMGDSFKDRCYIDAAVKSKDIKLCEEITSETLQQACKAIASNDSSLCEEISEEDIKNECYRLCNSLIGEGNKTAKNV